MNVFCFRYLYVLVEVLWTLIEFLATWDLWDLCDLIMTNSRKNYFVYCQLHRAISAKLIYEFFWPDLAMSYKCTGRTNAIHNSEFTMNVHKQTVNNADSLWCEAIPQCTYVGGRWAPNANRPPPYRCTTRPYRPLTTALWIWYWWLGMLGELSGWPLLSRHTQWTNGFGWTDGSEWTNGSNPFPERNSCIPIFSYGSVVTSGIFIITFALAVIKLLYQL